MVTAICTSGAGAPTCGPVAHEGAVTRKVVGPGGALGCAATVNVTAPEAFGTAPPPDTASRLPITLSGATITSTSRGVPATNPTSTRTCPFWAGESDGDEGVAVGRSEERR